MKAILCCPLFEGYGQTENTAAAFVQDDKDPMLGHCGGVVVNYVANIV
jgi:long-subunit acyl-CoA synthetase (AMP-forming)